MPPYVLGSRILRRLALVFIVIGVDVLDAVVQVSLILVSLPDVAIFAKFLIWASSAEEPPAVWRSPASAVWAYVAPQLACAMCKVAQVTPGAVIFFPLKADRYFVVLVSNTLWVSSLASPLGPAVPEERHPDVMA